MIAAIKPVLDSLSILVMTFAFGEVFFLCVPLENERLKRSLIIPIGMIAWAVLALIFSVALKVTPQTLTVLLWACCGIALSLTLGRVVTDLRRGTALVGCIVLVACLFHRFQIPGTEKLALGDFAEYMQIAKNIIDGLGYKVNFLLTDHFNNGIDDLIRPANNRFPLIPFQVASVGSLIGFSPYLINCIMLILAVNCLSALSGYCDGRFKKMLVWLMPFIFFKRGVYLWAGALELEVLAYLFAIALLLYEVRGVIRIKEFLLICLLEVGLLYGGNGTGFFVFGTTAAGLFAVVLYQKIFSDSRRLLGFRQYLLCFVVAPVIIFSPWVLQGLRSNVSGNALFHFVSYDEKKNRLLYGKRFYEHLSSYSERSKFGEKFNTFLRTPDPRTILPEEGLHEETQRLFPLLTNPYFTNFIMSYYFFSDDNDDFSVYFENKDLKDFIVSCMGNRRFLKRCLIQTVEQGMVIYSYFWGTNSFLYFGIIPFLFFFLRPRDVLFYLALLNGCILLYAGIVGLFAPVLGRMFIPFLAFHWAAVTFMIQKLPRFAPNRKVLVGSCLALFSIVIFHNQTVRESRGHADALAIAEWIRENTRAEDVVYVVPSQLFANLTGRKTIGTSWSDIFIEMAEMKYRPDYFVLYDFYKEPIYRKNRDYVYGHFQVLADDPALHYLIFRSKP